MNDCCFARDLLPLYEDRAVSPETAEALRQHLSQCPECREYFKQVKHITKSMQRQTATPDYRYSEVARRIRRYRIAGIAAAGTVLGLALYLGAMLIINEQTGGEA